MSTSADLQLDFERTGEAPLFLGVSKSGWGGGGSNLWGVLSSECLRPVDDGGHMGVAPFCSGVLGGRVLSKNSGNRGAPKRTRFLDVEETPAISARTERQFKA